VQGPPVEACVLRVSLFCFFRVHDVGLRFEGSPLLLKLTEVPLLH